MYEDEKEVKSYWGDIQATEEYLVIYGTVKDHPQ